MIRIVTFEFWNSIGTPTPSGYLSTDDISRSNIFPMYGSWLSFPPTRIIGSIKSTVFLLSVTVNLFAQSPPLSPPPLRQIDLLVVHVPDCNSSWTI